MLIYIERNSGGYTSICSSGHLFGGVVSIEQMGDRNRREIFHCILCSLILEPGKYTHYPKNKMKKIQKTLFQCKIFNLLLKLSEFEQFFHRPIGHSDFLFGNYAIYILCQILKKLKHLFLLIISTSYI